MNFCIDDFFRSCAWCHRWQWKTDFFCESCWECLLRERTALTRPIHGCYVGLNVMSLWDWREDSNRRLESLIYGLKGGGLASVQKRLAWYWVEKATRLHQKVDPRAIIVPAPPMIPGYPDHAWGLANALSDLLHRPLILALERQNQGEQKTKGRGGRLGIELRKVGDLPLECPQVIFVDDVITTGATAMAAKKALKAHRGFFVWTLAERGRPTLAPIGPP